MEPTAAQPFTREAPRLKRIVRRTFRIDPQGRTPMDTENIIYQIKVTLRGTRPAIWRRIMVPKNITLRKLHEILQVAMGWTDSHLHHFRLGKAYYGTPSDEGGMK